MSGAPSADFRVPSRAPAAEPAVAGTLTSITSDEYESFPKFGNSRPIKFVVLPDQAGKWTRLYFIDPRKFAFHHEFLATLPEFKGLGFKQVEAISLKATGRKVLLGTLRNDMLTGRPEDELRSTFAFLLTTEEVPDLGVIKQVMKLVTTWTTAQKDVFGFDDLRFQPTPGQELIVSTMLAQFAKQNIPVFFAHSAGDQRVYNVGWGVGSVVAYATADQVEKAVADGQLGPDTILITGADLRELPPVAGVISEVPLTEASHLVLLAQMYGMPLVYEKSALKKRAASVGKWTLLQTAPDSEISFEFYDRINQTDLATLREMRARPKVRPPVDWTDRPIVEVATLKPTDVAAYGGKSTQFGLIRRTIPQFTRPVVAGIPVSYYRRFLQTSRTADGVVLNDALTQLLAAVAANPSYAQIQELSARIRETMKSAKLDATLVDEIRAGLAVFFPGSGSGSGSASASGNGIRIRLRSSSNVEDGAEFNGAGLYESHGTCLSGCEKDDFAKDLVKTWSSLFTARGLWARRQFGVDESQVGMGLTVERPYKGEFFNGVVRYRENRVEILGVPGESDSITNPTQGGLNERVVMDGKDLDFSEVRPLKGSPADRLMMRTEHYRTLAQLMSQLYTAWPQKADGLEIESEWKLIPENGTEKINIKQVRRIPKAPTVTVAGGKRILFTSGQLNFVSDFAYEAASIPYRFDSISVDVANMTDAQMTAGAVNVTGARGILRGKSFDFKVGTPKISDDQYYQAFEVSLIHPDLPAMTLKVSLSKSNAQILTPSSPQFSAELSMNGISDSDSWRFGLLAVDQRARVETLEPLRRDYKLKRHGCPILVTGTSASRWTSNDNEFRSLENTKVSGVLKRTLEIGGFPKSTYYQQLHEGREEVFVDLFGDKKLTTAEKQSLQQMGRRFLLGDQGQVKFVATFGGKASVVKGCDYGSGGNDE